MFYDVIVNGRVVATVGPTELEHLSISISTSSHDDGAPFMIASGLSPRSKDGEQTYTTWIERELSEEDHIQISPSKRNKPSEPIKTRRLRHRTSEPREERFCDFCKQSEEIVGAIVQTGETPFICKYCTELCMEIFREREP